ncbi:MULTISPECIES: class I SAM-dependent methyltransferase [unclassified Methylobacterium]|jgi:SAM-dependent methyltransferase|uniref:class I SAM-dependent methyltransferase n=1 Tax=unclassified Methylobacterium TaxID=2615210 RepID=UPI001354E918|nr:class I SAM-dependent methyltransferase [Methylobacterium sp. 2A]MWV26034.1 class I SAM-dependent methyltransferase [Methylobacterium sp. 2A]
MAGGITQAEYWNGEVGTRWARNQAVLDAVFAPLTDALFDRAGLKSGTRVLDIGCGSGATTVEAARRVAAAGSVTGADISAPLLAVARARVGSEASGGAPVTFVEADVERADLGSFDAALSRFGVMFFPDSRRAFANIRRMLRPGGQLTFLCWRALPENLWVQVPREAVMPLLPEVPPPPAPDTPGPFRFADGDALSVLLRGAGFETVTCEAVDRDVALGRGDTDAAAAEAAAHVALNLGPTSHLVREAEPDLQARAEAAVTEALRRHAEGGTVHLRAACWLVQAA